MVFSELTESVVAEEVNAQPLRRVKSRGMIRREPAKENLKGLFSNAGEVLSMVFKLASFPKDLTAGPIF